MKNTTLPAASASVSGGITGLITYFMIYGMNAAAFNPLALLGLSAGFSCLAALLAFALLLVFSVLFGENSKNEARPGALVFLIPSLSVFCLPLYAKFYSRLSALSPSVFGNIYLPFHGYEHVDMARFFLICSLGALWLAVFFIIAARFIIKFYSSKAAMDERKTKKTLFWFAFIFFILTTSFITLIYPPTGDEPHYLVTARSMAADLDLDLSNNYTSPSEYRRFFPSEFDYRNLHTIQAKTGGAVLTAHDMGLPFLILPFVKFGGRYAVQFFMNFTAALLCVALYMMLSGLGIKTRLSAAAAMAASICMPLMAGSSLVLTEIPAALIFAYSVYILYDREKRGLNPLFFTLLAFLPWLHLKFIIFPVVFYAFYYFTAVKDRNFNLKKELINNIPVFVLGALYVLFYYKVYGIIAPFGVKELHENIYAADASQQQNTFMLNPAHFFTSAFAVIFDRDYGLLPYCLMFVLSLWGMLRAFAAKRPGLFLPFMLAAPYMIVFLLWKDWTGSMTPGRQLIPVIPIFVFYAAYFIESLNFLKTRLFKFLFTASLLFSWLLAVFPPLRYGASKNKIYAFITARAPEQLLWFFPPFTESTAAGMAVSAVYIAIIITGYYYYAGSSNTKR